MKKDIYTLTIQFTNGGSSCYHEVTQARAYFLLAQAERLLAPGNRIARWKISTGWQDFA